MNSRVIKVAYIGDIDLYSKKTYRYQYMGKGILSFKPTISTLIGADFSYYKHDDLFFQIWEINTDKKFDNIKSLYYHGCTAGIVIFSLNNIHKINGLVQLVEEIWQGNGKGPIPIAFIGIRDIYSEVNEAIYEAYNNQIEILISKYKDQKESLRFAYFESSLQFGENSTEVFSFFNYLLNKNYLDNLSIEETYPKQNVRIIENQDIVKEYLSETFNRELVISENHVKIGKCVADRSIITLNSTTFECKDCKNLFCSQCYAYYSKNPDLHCPGSISKRNLHFPNFNY